MTTQASPIEQLIQETEASEINVGTLLQRPGANAFAEPGLDGQPVQKPGVIVEDMTSAGYVWLYDTITRQGSKCNRNMVPAQLKQKREDGSLVYTLTAPSQPPFLGSYKCFLHAEHPKREEVVAALGVVKHCRKGTMGNKLAADSHSRRVHRDEWAAYQNYIEETRREREDRDRAEDRELNRQLLATMRAGNVVPTEVTIPPDFSNPSDPFFEIDVTTKEVPSTDTVPTDKRKRKRTGREWTPEQKQAAKDRIAARTPEEVQEAKDKMVMTRAGRGKNNG